MQVDAPLTQPKTPADKKPFEKVVSIFSLIVEDAPKAIAVSALGTILVILLAFRGRMLAFGVFLPWLLGVSSLLGFLFLKDIRLNFLNFVAIPITIGIGAEYAHNVMQRFRIEGGNRCCGYPRCSCGKRDGGRPTLLP